MGATYFAILRGIVVRIYPREPVGSRYKDMGPRAQMHPARWRELETNHVQK